METKNNKFTRFKQGEIVIDSSFVRRYDMNYTDFIFIIDHNITNGIKKHRVGARDITTGNPKALTYPRMLWTIEELCDYVNGNYDMMQYFVGCGKMIGIHTKMNMLNQAISLARYVNHNIDQLPITVRAVLYNQLTLDPKERVVQEMNRILNLSDRIGKISEILKTTPDLEPSLLDYDYDDDDDMDEDDDDLD